MWPRNKKKQSSVIIINYNNHLNRGNIYLNSSSRFFSLSLSMLQKHQKHLMRISMKILTMSSSILFLFLFFCFTENHHQNQKKKKKSLHEVFEMFHTTKTPKKPIFFDSQVSCFFFFFLFFCCWKKKFLTDPVMNYD